jgi:hypothetical protein
MSILAHLKARDPRAGFATDILVAMRGILPGLASQPQLRVITNAGGLNPIACAESVAKQLVGAGLGGEQIGVVLGDDLLGRIADLQAAGCELAQMDTGQPLGSLGGKLACANAYLGAQPIVAALADGARVVITGRVADASLTVAPAVHEFHWSWNDWNRLSAATVAGHLIECGAQVTGGYADRWREIDYVDIGYPIAEMASDGETVITKPAGSSGIVDRRSVVEQLVYEIGDPQAYYTPDVIADFTTVDVAEAGPDRVRVWGATGTPASDFYKASLAYRAGYAASAQLLVWGNSALEKCRRTGELVLARLASVGCRPESSLIECLGAGYGVPLASDSEFVARGARAPQSDELVLRLSVRDSRREVVERFTCEIAPLITNGPNGLAGYASGRPSVRPVLAYWPTLIPKSLIQPRVEVRTAANWCARGDRS